jgi:hypothetical protein
VVARYGDAPKHLRAGLVDGGWHTQGVLAYIPREI